MEKDISPVLPLELERIIFEMATEEIIGDLPSARCALNLQLTATRVRCWVRPLIYRVFRWSWPQDIFHAVSRPTPTFRPEEGNGPFVKHLFLRHTSYSHHIESMKKVIQHCPNTEDMAVWCGADNLPKLYPIFSYLRHLKRFSGCIEDLSRDQMLSPVFRGLTHLQINGEVPLDILIQLKTLTHLRCCIPEGSYEHSRKVFLSRVCSEDGCPWLQVIKVFAKHAELVHDVRIVIMNSWMQIFMIADADWLAGANGRLDSWEFASRIVHARNSGYMEYVPNRIFDMNEFEYEEELNEAGQVWWRSLP